MRHRLTVESAGNLLEALLLSFICGFQLFQLALGLLQLAVDVLSLLLLRQKCR